MISFLRPRGQTPPRGGREIGFSFRRFWKNGIRSRNAVPRRFPRFVVFVPCDISFARWRRETSASKIVTIHPAISCVPKSSVTNTPSPRAKWRLPCLASGANAMARPEVNGSRCKGSESYARHGKTPFFFPFADGQITEVIFCKMRHGLFDCAAWTFWLP